jgi:hypothetical protein
MNAQSLALIPPAPLVMNEAHELDDCELDAVVGGFVTQLMAEAQKMSFMMAAADAVIKAIGEHPWFRVSAIKGSR